GADSQFEALVLTKGAGKVTPANNAVMRKIFDAEPEKFGEYLNTLPEIHSARSVFAGDKDASGGHSGGATQHPFFGEVERIVASKKCSKADAIREVNRTRPDLAQQLEEHEQLLPRRKS